MKIDHMAMYVTDIEHTKEFFVKFFEAKAGNKYYNQNTGFQSYFLTFEDGARLEIMTKQPLLELSKDPLRTGYAHLAFSVGNMERVNALTARLQAEGYEVLSGPRTTGDGYFESCIVGIEGNLIEITV